ncbi:proton channel OTOP2-like [Ambystoma mexicanum]|uniref:proton channel OTOP2-like n=1 Tax=Ambystoma mexicanum TaxID=8296 RepID=UPI0037E90890
MISTQRSAMLVSATSVNSSHIPEDRSNEVPFSQNSPLSSVHSSSSNGSSMEGTTEAWQGSPDPRTASLLSLLYLILLTFSGSAILLAEIHHHSLQSRNIHGFLILLMLTSSGWMLWFGWRSAKNKKRKMHQDPHAGASWLKGGLSLFALATLVLDCLTLGYYHELQHCVSALITAFPVIQAVFTVIQVSILSFYAKVCIQDKQQLNRFGLMHTLATNILMWMRMVLDESMEQLEEIYHAREKDSVNSLHEPSSHSNSCVCITNLCNIFYEGADYLHPFNIEFSLFSSTMLYVIWKNTGHISRLPDPGKQKKENFHIVGAFGGLILGALAISATFGVMISFGVLAKSPETVPEALRTYYIFNSVLLSAMFVACVIGIATYRMKNGRTFLDRSKSVVRSLDITLLLGTSCGPLMVSVFSLVAIFFVHNDDNLHLFDLCFSLCKTIQILGQNFFITEALYSGPAKKHLTLCTDWVFSISTGSTNELIQNPMNNVSTDYESRCTSCSATESHLHTKLLVDVEKDIHQNMVSYSSLSDVSQKQSLISGGKHKMLSTRKKILQNISILLIFYNISVWILYAYGTRPHLVSQIEQSFYGFTLWVIIVKISLPLGIFYRMHSVASLFEVYCKTC